MKYSNHFLSGYTNIFFDCDSTLTAIEGIDWLAKIKNKTKIIQDLTLQTVEGKLPFESVLKLRLDIIKPSREDIFKLGKEYIKNCLPYTKQAIALLRCCHKNVFIVSGGYRPAVNQLAQWLGVLKKNVYAIDIFFNPNGTYAGVDTDNPLARQNGKKIIIKNITANHSSMLIGDGATDLEAREVVDLFVGFGGVKRRPLVVEKSDVFINLPNLMPIVALANGTKFICYNKEENARPKYR
jgi:phosphoserine phosphatase